MTKAKTPGTKPAKARASASGTVESGFALYRKGDFKGAIEIWRPLAEAGNADAQAWMGSAYANGEGVAIDDAKAFQWYLRSAEGGNAQAQANIGAFYLMAKGVAKNESEGVRWLSAAAEQGDMNALFNLAVLYTKGQGVKEDRAKAAELYRKAAERGHYPSQARLGHAFANGIGVEKNRIEAFTWLSLAGQHGIGTALQELESVVKLMSIEEKQAALRAFETLRARLASETGPSRLPIRLGG